MEIKVCIIRAIICLNSITMLVKFPTQLKNAQELKIVTKELYLQFT